MEVGDYFNFIIISIFSSLQSTTSIEDLINKAKSDNFPAVGMVDLGNMMGAFKFIPKWKIIILRLKKAHQEYIDQKQKAEEEGVEFSETEPQQKTIIPVLGCEFYISDRPEQKQFTKDDPDRRTNMVLLDEKFHRL